MSDIQTKIQNMLDEIPDGEYDEHRREYSISKSSARWMANMMLMITEASGCNHGFSPEQAAAFKQLTPKTIHDISDIVKERRKVFAWIGALVTALGTACLGLMVYIGKQVFDAPFWQKLFTKWGQP